MKYTWPAWRLVASGKTSYTEITEKMSLTDIFDMYDVIDALNEAENKMRKNDEKKK